MIEQQTAREFIHTAQSWGPIGTGIFVVVVFIGYQVYSNFVLKKKAFDPITQMRLDINTRPTFKELSEKLEKYMLEKVARSEFDSVKRELDDIKRIVEGIDRKIK